MNTDTAEFLLVRLCSFGLSNAAENWLLYAVLHNYHLFDSAEWTFQQIGESAIFENIYSLMLQNTTVQNVVRYAFYATFWIL